MLLKALGAKYLSRYKSYSAPWTITLDVGHNRTAIFHIDELTVDTNKEINGKGQDDLGAFELTGKVNTQGFAEFEKKYTSGSSKHVTQFHGNFTNCYLTGNWVVKGQGTGKFEMRMDHAMPFVLQVGPLQEIIYLTFLEKNSRIHSVGILKSPTSPDKRFFILNGKVFSEDKHGKEVAMKLCYPQHPEEDYYMGEMKIKDGIITIEGTAETHTPGGLFGSKTAASSKFQLTALPEVGMNLMTHSPGFGSAPNLPHAPMLYPPGPRGPSGDHINTQGPVPLQRDIHPGHFLHYQYQASGAGGMMMPPVHTQPSQGGPTMVPHPSWGPQGQIPQQLPGGTAYPLQGPPPLAEISRAPQPQPYLPKPPEIPPKDKGQDQEYR